MVMQQRYAVFTLAVAGAALGLFLLLTVPLGWARAQAGFSLLAIWGLSPLLFRRGGQDVGWDERDRLIHLRSLQWTGGVVWVCFVGTLMGLSFVHHFAGTMDVQVLPLLVFLGTSLFLSVQSVSLLVLYRWM